MRRLSIATAVTLTAPDLATLGAGGSAEKQRPSSDDSDRQPADGCAICAVMSLANMCCSRHRRCCCCRRRSSFLIAVATTEFIHLNPIHPAFQSRALPIPDFDCIDAPRSPLALKQGEFRGSILNSRPSKHRRCQDPDNDIPTNDERSTSVEQACCCYARSAIAPWRRMRLRQLRRRNCLQSP